MFTKIRFKFELFSFYFKKYLLIIIVSIFVGLLFAAYQKQLINIFKKNMIPPTKIGIEGQFTINNLPISITNLISYGLTETTQNQRLTISPLVKEISINQNKNEYVFTIDTDKAWHDGKKVLSSDIKYEIPGLIFSYPAPNTLKITSDKPYSPLESNVSKPIFKNNLIGLGRYKVDSIKYQAGYVKQMILVSDDKTTFIYKFYQNQADLISAFKIGEVNQIELSTIPNEISSGIQVDIVKNIITNTKYSAIFLNTQKLNTKQLRQALAYATPKSTDKNDRCLSPISSTSWAYNPSVKEYNFNPARARELFTNNKIDSINLSVSNRDLLSTAEDVKKSWEDILKLKVNLTVGQIDTNDYDAIIHYGPLPTDPDQYIFWHSTQTKTNTTKLNNPKIDKLLEDGRATLDIIERKNIYQEFQKVLLEESPAIFLSYPTVYTVTRIK